MSDNCHFLIVGSLLYFGLVGIFLLVLSFNRRNKRALPLEEDAAKPDKKRAMNFMAKNS